MNWLTSMIFWITTTNIFANIRATNQNYSLFIYIVISTNKCWDTVVYHSHHAFREKLILGIVWNGATGISTFLNNFVSSRKFHSLDRVFIFEKFDSRFMDDVVTQNQKDRLFLCFRKKIQSHSIEYSSRYYRGLTVFHSMAYTRSGSSISFRVSIMNEACPMQRQSCLGEILFYLNVHEESYAFVKLFYCINCCFSKALPTVHFPD